MGLESIAGTDVGLRNALKAERLPVDDLAEAGRTFFRVREGANTFGFGGYELYGEHALIRSLVVLPEARKRGIGRQVAEQILEHARNEGARRAYLLTEFGLRILSAARLSIHRARGGSGRDPGHASGRRALSCFSHSVDVRSRTLGDPLWT